MTDFSAELRAFGLLQWVPFSLPGEFDEDLAADGHYTKLQRQRSNQALDAWDKQHPREQSDELAAFMHLEWLGVYTQHDFFSPAKAKNGYYTKRLRDITAARKSQGVSGITRSPRKVRSKRHL